ncbi:MAG: leucyl/phenylalanyl-tRNA--protein transferase [Alphaproteobacteria bacterium]
MFAVTPELLLRAYAAGIFPMARDREDSELQWFDPELRGILPLDGFHVPRRLLRVLRRDEFEVRCDTAFEVVLEGCAEPVPDRSTTWISRKIRTLYTALFHMGHAHSVETWREGRLVGGLYGVSLGAAFFGESMFSRETNASKIALCHLVARLKQGGFLLLDTQFLTRHLSQFGAVEIPRAVYQERLALAIRQRATFPGRLGTAASELLSLRHSSSQTS